MLPATPSTCAEDYHQKYRLRSHRELDKALHDLYPDEAAFRDSTAAARANALLSGVDAPIDDLDVPDAVKEMLRAVGPKRPATCPK